MGAEIGLDDRESLWRTVVGHDGGSTGGRARSPLSGGDAEAAGEMRTSRLVLIGAAIGTIVGTARADLNATPRVQPGLAPHVCFHGAAGWGRIAGAQVLALWLLWRPASSTAEQDLAARTAALPPAVAWAPFLTVLTAPGTAVENELGHLPRVAGSPLTLLP